MKKILLAASALTMLVAGPALAQTAPDPVGAAGNVAGTAVGTAGNVAGTAIGTAGTVATAPFAALGMGGNGMGGGTTGRSCVSNGAFVPCAPPMMSTGMRDDMGGRRMTRREMRAERRMMRQHRDM